MIDFRPYQFERVFQKLPAAELVNELDQYAETKYRCPQPGCRSVVARIDVHLKKRHNLQTGTPEYIAAKDRAHLPEFKIVSVNNLDAVVVADDNANNADDGQMDNPAPDAGVVNEAAPNNDDANVEHVGQDNDNDESDDSVEERRLEFTNSDEFWWMN